MKILIKKLIIIFTGITPDFLFIFLINFYCYFFKKKINFRKADNYWVCYDKKIDENIFYLHKNRSFLYLNGIENRLNLLATQYLIKDVEFTNNDVIVDCGANIGEVGLYFKMFYPFVKYYSFEASKLEFQCLLKNLNNFGINYNSALWNKQDILKFYVSSKKADSSIIKPVNFSHEIEVNAETLDSYKFKKIKFFKLEAEGAEPEILMGAINSLRNIEIISADVGFERGVKLESTIKPVSEILTKNNFYIEDIYINRLVLKFINNKF